MTTLSRSSLLAAGPAAESAEGPGMNRRAVFTSIPVAVLSGIPHVASGAAEDPILPLFEEWLSARRTWRELADLPGNGDWDDPRSIDAERREMSAVDQMLQTAPTTLAGLAALAALAWSFVSPGRIDPWEFERMAKADECQAVLAIWRACGGGSGYPPG